MSKLVLGINAYHGDSSACIVREGVLMAAAEEERFRRVKHWAGFPVESVRYCLAEAGLRLSDIQHVAINQDSTANLVRKVGYTFTNRPNISFLFDRIRNKRQRAGVDLHLREAFPDDRFAGQVHHVEHHLAHLASAFLVSPFECSVVVSVDGFGDFASAAWGVGKGNRLETDARVYFPHSLGIFYQAMTQYLGFPHYGDEYKIMGLAPYGTPSLIQDMRRVVKLLDDGSFELDLQFFRHHCDKIEYEWENGEPTVGTLYSPALENLLGPARRKEDELTQRHKDIARSVQAMYEEAFFHLLNTLHRKYRLDDLAVAGGCGMNSVANGRIYRNTPFKRVYVQAAAGDAGGAIGAAFAVWQELSGEPRQFVMDHAYWGPSFSNDEIASLLKRENEALSKANCKVCRFDGDGALCDATATAIADGKVVGWFQGRMEWGPRALGNRSIVCDPRRADMKDMLNLKIKRRESFRPFAPSILREAVADWFETDDDVPFMMQVYQIREDRRSRIPAVTHVDGSGRLQTVNRETNPRYYALIESFRAKTGVPVVLNTSFNENEPVVCRPDEALACFLRTKMDVLVLGDFFITRTDAQ